MLINHSSFTRLVSGLFLVSILLFNQGCYEKEFAKGELSFLLQPESGNVSSKAGKFSLTIQAKSSWSIYEDAEWLELEPRFGEGDATVWVQVDENGGGERSAILAISTVDKSYVQRILQAKSDQSGEDNHSGGESGGSNGNTGLGDISKRMEIPLLNNTEDDLFIAHTTDYNGKVVANYSLEYVKSKQHVRWVAFSFYHETAGNNVGRSDEWADDPQVPAQYLAQRDDYPYPPYDRGHIVASADRVYSQEGNEQTFYYSNITPQYSYFNRYVWTKFEGAVRDWGRSDSFRDTLYVVKGGTIDDKIIELTQPNNIVPVPKYFYMALLNYKDGQYQGMAFWIEHRKDYKANDVSVSNYAISIDELESKTGINFFHNLPDNIENKVEANLDKSRWGGM